MSENLYETSGKLKVLMDTSKGGKPNWYMVINDMDNVEHRGYSNQDLSLYKKKLDAEETILISAKGGTATHQGGKNEGKHYFTKGIISDWLSEDTEEKPDVAPNGLNGNSIKDNTQNEMDISLKLLEMLENYERSMKTVDSSDYLGKLQESNRKDIATTFFLSLQRR